MGRKSGYSLIGSTPNVVVPNFQTRNISVCAAMTVCGLKEFQISNSAFNTEKFGIFIQSLFNSFTSETSEPCVFVMDNVAFHKTAEIRSIFEN
jgi:hypothetical protein